MRAIADAAVSVPATMSSVDSPLVSCTVSPSSRHRPMTVSGCAVPNTSSMCPVSRSTITRAAAIFSGGSTVSEVVPSAVAASSSPVSKISR